MLTIRNVSKTYGQSAGKAVDNLSFEAKSGEIFGFLGPNGAGKTTTIKMITGVIAPDSGEIIVGASVGPYIMGAVLTGGQTWNMDYRYIAVLQTGLTAVLLFSLPLWKNRRGEHSNMTDIKSPPLPLRQVVAIPGAKEIMLTFFCYCAVEQTANLWASSYLVLYQRLPAKEAAGLASLFFIGITVGRFFSGFLTLKLNDTQMIRLEQGGIAAGIVLLFLSFGKTLVLPLIGLGLIGLGCAPIYPSIIHATPAHFGEDMSQAMIGVQMASAYAGTCLMPPLFGPVANHIGVALMPLYLAVILIVMIVTHEKMLAKTL